MNTKPTIDDLKQRTDAFFRRHWNITELGSEPPQWLEVPARFQGSVPNYDKGGCYALVEGQNVLYIGLGASQGGGIYKEHGIIDKTAEVCRSSGWRGGMRATGSLAGHYRYPNDWVQQTPDIYRSGP